MSEENKKDEKISEDTTEGNNEKIRMVTLGYLQKNVRQPSTALANQEKETNK